MKDFKVLYRKYRPSNFDEVVGQNNVVKILKNSIINNKISHAYIFNGPRGTGKTSSAKIFARTINCENPIDGILCGKCDHCLSNNASADIIEIDAASNNGVDEIRELINNVKVAPTNSKYKVYIIDEVHMLSQSAFNALLLTLEEPPSHAVFILATTNIESVPITVLSRCQRFDFTKISDDDIVNQLDKICNIENIKISDDALKEIAYLSDGGLRDSLSILNQLSTSSDNIDLDLVLSNYGSISNLKIRKIADYFVNNNYDNLKKSFDELSNKTFDYKLFIKKLIDVLFENSIDMKNKHAENNFERLKAVIFELNELINDINININPFILIFLILVGHIKINDNKPIVEIKEEQIKELAKQENPIDIELIDVDTTENNNILNEDVQKIVSIRLNNCFATANKNYLSSAKKEWNDYKTNKCTDFEIQNMVIDSEVVMASPDIYILVMEQDIMADIVNKNVNKIMTDYNSVFNKKIKIVALSLENWNKEKKIYVEKIKKGEKYTIIEEKNEKKSDIIESVVEKNDNFDITNIFEHDKVEIR